MEPNDAQASVAVEETPAIEDGIDPSKFHHSVSYSIDDSPKTETPPAEVDQQTERTQSASADRPRDEQGKFRKQEEHSAEEKPVPLPKSIKVPKSHDPNDIGARFSSLRDSHEDLKRKYRELEAQVKQPPKLEQREPQAQTEEQAVERFVEEKIRKELQQKQEAEEARRKEEAIETYYAEKRSEFSRHAQPIIQQIPNFYELIADNKNVPITDPMAHAIIELGAMGPYTALYLATNPDKAKEIAGKSPFGATIAIAKIADQLEREVAQGQVNGQSMPSNGQPKPKPVPDIRGLSPGDTLDEEARDDDDTETWLRKESARKRRLNPTEKFYGRF